MLDNALIYSKQGLESKWLCWWIDWWIEGIWLAFKWIFSCVSSGRALPERKVPNWACCRTINSPRTVNDSLICPFISFHRNRLRGDWSGRKQMTIASHRMARNSSWPISFDETALGRAKQMAFAQAIRNCNRFFNSIMKAYWPKCVRGGWKSQFCWIRSSQQGWMAFSLQANPFRPSTHPSRVIYMLVSQEGRVLRIEPKLFSSITDCKLKRLLRTFRIQRKSKLERATNKKFHARKYWKSRSDNERLWKVLERTSDKKSFNIFPVDLRKLIVNSAHEDSIHWLIPMFNAAFFWTEWEKSSVVRDVCGAFWPTALGLALNPSLWSSRRFDSIHLIA